MLSSVGQVTPRFSFHTDQAGRNFLAVETDGFKDFAVSCYSYISTPMTVSLLGDESLRSTVISEGTADYFAYWAVYQQKDLSVFPAGYTPGAVAAVNTTSSENGSIETDQPAPSTGMSTGARIGIGVGVGIAVLLLLGVVIFLISSYRRKKRDAGSRRGESEPLGSHEKPELEGSAGAASTQPGQDYRKAELDAHGTHAINEVSGHSSSRAELEADPRATIRHFDASYDRYELDGATEVRLKQDR